MQLFTKILCAGYSEGDLGKSEWARIEKLSKEVTLLSKESPDLMAEITTSDCLLVKLGAKVGRDVLEAAPNLRYIGMLGTGCGGIDVSYAAQRGVTVCNIAGYSTDGVTEFLFGILLEHLRRISDAKLQGKSGNYSEDGYTGTEIKDKRFGVIGLGRIGHQVARLASKGFGSDVMYWSRNRKHDAEGEGIAYKDVNTICKEADILSLNLPYVPDTENFLNREHIFSIKAGSILINVSPMQIIDFSALIDRLAAGDVTFIMDHSDELSDEQAQSLTQFGNCVMYPPIGYTTEEASMTKVKMFVDNLENYLAGSPTNCVTQ